MANDDSTTFILVAEGDKYFQASSTETCNNVPEYGYLNKYFYVDGNITIQNFERIPNSHFTGSYNLGITDYSYDSLVNDESQTIIIFDHEDGKLESRTYKFLSHADNREGPLLETRSRNTGSEVYVRMPVAHDGEMSDQAKMNQWWHIQYVKSDGSDHYYYIQNLWSGLVLTSNDRKVEQQKYTEANSQLWNIKHLTSVFYTIRNLENNLYLDHDTINETVFLSERKSGTESVTQEFYVFGIMDYESKEIPAGFNRYDLDDDEITCEEGCEKRGARHVSKTFYSRIFNGSMSFKTKKLSKGGLYNCRINYATNYDNKSIEIYANNELQQTVNLSNNMLPVSNIHNVQCNTDGLHSGNGNVTEFTMKLKKGVNEIRFVNYDDNYVDIDYLDLSDDPFEVLYGNFKEGELAGLILFCFMMAVVLVIAIMIVIKRCKKEESTEMILHNSII